MEPKLSKVTYTYDGEILYDQQTEGKLPIIKIENQNYCNRQVELNSF